MEFFVGFPFRVYGTMEGYASNGILQYTRTRDVNTCTFSGRDADGQRYYILT